MPKDNRKPLANIKPAALRLFWDNFIVGTPDECWEWQGAFSQNYAYLSGYLASRVSYYIKYGIDPGIMLVCHRCDNPPCINWNHLFLGTMRDNSLDRHAKGRTVMPTIRAIGEGAPCVKLTCNNVREIRDLMAVGFGNSELGRNYGVSHETIRAIRLGVTWKHIS